MNLGDVRVVKKDNLNYVVQVCIMQKDKEGNEKGLGWDDRGYYGAYQFPAAFKKAVLLGLPEDEVITASLLNECISSVKFCEVKS